MTGVHLYVIVALLMIYPQSTNQSDFDGEFYRSITEMEKELRQENSILEFESKNANVACDILTPDEKQTLCDLAMNHMVANERFMTGTGDEIVNTNCRNIRINKFLDTESTLPVPPLANENDPFTCVKMKIVEIDMEKPMFWCKNRVFTVWSDKTDPNNEIDRAEAEGFFITGSRLTPDTAFIFKPSKTDSGKVTMTAEITSMRLLEEAFRRHWSDYVI